MKSFNWRLVVGGLLVLVGILAFLDSFLVIPFTTVLWGLIFAVGGVSFLVYLLGNRSAWWALLPGIILLSLSALIMITSLFPVVGDKLGGMIFLGGTALAFWLVYIWKRSMWWAIIPAGVFTSLAGTVLIDQFTKLDGGMFFLFGLAVTFALLAILPGLPGNRQWPWIPAGVLFIISLLTVFTSLSSINYFWAILLIGGGLYLILRPALQKKS